MSTRRSSIGVRSTIATIAEGCFEIVPGAGRRIALYELHLIQTVATSAAYGAGRPAAAGVTPTANLFQKNGASDEASTTSGVVAWGGTRPTQPAIFHRRLFTAATIGVGILFSFPDGIEIAAGGTFTVHNITATPLCDINAVIGE